jgi:serine/threonine protein kinase
VFSGITVSAGIDKFPAEWLTPTVLHSYLLPCLILGVVVGGSATVVHRDIKPDNIMLVNCADGDLVKVLGFGSAKLNGGGTGPGPTS